MHIGVNCGKQGTKAPVIDPSGRGPGYAFAGLIEPDSSFRARRPSTRLAGAAASVRMAPAPRAAPTRSVNASCA